MSEQKILRAIKKVWKSQPTIEGAGVHLRRAFGFHDLPLLDPFLLLDDFRSENPEEFKAGFPWHPHRGIETITYVLDGDVEHADSLGHRGDISTGDVQWMTAGSGIVHQEMPKGNSKGEMLGFQLWSNLPAASKMMAPRYRDVKRNDIPVITTSEGAKVRIICGTVEGTQGPVQDIMSDPEFLDVEIAAGKSFTRTFKADHTVFAYVIDGKGYFDPKRAPFSHEAAGVNYFDMDPPCACENGMLVLYGPGTEVSIATDTDSVRFLLISGKPLNEPIAWYGPIVMNTQEELKQAFQELQAGTFVKR